MEGIGGKLGRIVTQVVFVAALAFTLAGPAGLSAQTPPPQLTLTVTDAVGGQITAGFRWLLEEDATYPVTPGVHDPNSLSFNFHRSYMPVVDKGDVLSGGQATVTIPDPTKRYFISVLPHVPAGANCALPTAGCYSMSGAQVASGQTTATVVLPPQPIPTAQIFIMAFEDVDPINNAFDLAESGLGGFTVILSDSGGQLLTDAYGNPLGTVYSGVEATGAPVIQQLGSGLITTMAQADVNDPAKNPYNLKVGEALVKNLMPGKYGVQLNPPVGQDWQQTATIEGTKTIDAWVKAKEPRYMFELGPAGHHAEFGFVRPFATPLGGSGSISGRIVNRHMSRPPDYTFHNGHPLPNCWVGLNEFVLGRAGRGLYAQPCNADSTFSIPNLPAGTYQLVIWDQFLDNIFSLLPVTVTGGAVNLGDVSVFRWFGAQDHYVFFDENQNGIRDPEEVGLRDQVVNLRFRDGSIYQSFPTDLDGYVPFDEVFPFFSWQVAEVDFLRFKATGVTVTVDAGGPVVPGEKLTPQIQADGQPTRTETGPVLLQGFQSFLGTTHKFEWGKANYGPGENGGISGIVQYAVTRAEDDPAYAAAETWETGIPRVQVVLYEDNGTGGIKDVNGVAGVQLADVDNYPFGWMEGTAPMGSEDLKRNALGGPTVFNAGDAVQIVRTDSWDDSLPSACPGNPADPFYQNGKCYDGLRNYSQVRPAVFDGGYAFTTKVPGGKSSGGIEIPLPAGFYIVEAVTPKGYEHQKEEDKNVDFGDTPTVGPLALPPVCVGDLHTVPAELTLFPGVAAPSAGQQRPLCDRKAVLLTNGQNPGVNFFLFTEVPVAAHVKGFILNDLGNEFNPLSPNFSEKVAPSWIPVSFRDWTGREIARVYSDEFGSYNALIPSTYNINVPSPSGVGPNILQACLNSPGPIRDPATGQLVIDPFFNRQYGQICWTLHYEVGKTTYADTPILPLSAFVGSGNWQLDCECPNGTPRIFSVSADGNGVGGGPYIAPVGSRVLTITSMGTVQVPDPSAIRTEGNQAVTIARDFGFGATPGTVTIGGVPLTNVTWTNGVITATVPAAAQTGQLVVTRSDNGRTTIGSVTVTVGNSGITSVRTVTPGTSIQSVLDAANPGDLVLVPPGSYFEMLVMTKPVYLQGWGAGSTQINVLQSLTNALQTWREKVNTLVNCAPVQITLLPGQTNNLPSASGPCGREVGTGLFGTEEGAGVLVATRPGVFSNVLPGRIDGFSMIGTSMSAGIMVNGYARFLQISNNQVQNNQGPFGGGIRLGHPNITVANVYVSAQNDHVNIHHNHIIQNGSMFGQLGPGAGVSLYTGSDDYRIAENYVCGNFSQGDGAGIAHYGLSPNGLITNNQILFNQGFDQTPGGGGSGGGILISGAPQPVGNAIVQTPGSGSVTIVSNLIQGNNAGSGDGGGVMLRNVNGQDVLVSPTNNSTWYEIQMFNNSIVNNVAGLAGGGIALQDAAKVVIINNTIAHNDSTATAGAAFTPGNPNQSNPQPAGVVSNRHTGALCQAFGLGTSCTQFSNPVLANNIVLNNRSLFWQVNTTTGIGQLVFSAVDDLAVLPRPTTNRLDPRSSILTAGNTGYHSSNLLVADSTTVFANAYFNAPPAFGTIQPNGTFLQPEITTGLQAAPALDEGGNYIDVHYGPLSPVGNYHLVGTSPAIDQGSNAYLASYPLLAADIDGNVRPSDGDGNGTLITDSGADERTATGPVVPPLPAGLVAAYAFNEGAGTTVADATGLGHTGTVVGATWTPSGRYGAGLVFNGTNARVTVPDAADLDLTTGVTLEAWVYPTTAGGGAWRTVITKDTAASGTYLLYANTDTNNAGMFVGSTFQQQTTGGPTLAANSWTHLTGTYDGSTIRLYVNGVQVASRAQTQPMTTNNALLSIGGSSVWGEWFAGRLDELRIYNRALTAAEIVADMAAPLGTTTNQAPAITSPAVTTAVATYAYSYQMTATDPNTGDTLTYSLTTAPAGMTVSATGLIAWTPTAAQVGPQAVTARVQDQGGLFATQSFTVTVAANAAPTITSAAVTTATVGVAYSYQVTATDPNAGTVLTYSLTTAPAGMTINATTHVISWTPTVAQTGPQAVTVRVQDQGGLFATQSFTVTVAGPVNQAPAITSPAVTTAVTTYAYNYQVVASDPNVGDTLTYSLTTAPAGMTVSATGLIAWTPTAAQVGPQAVTARVQDQGGLFATQSFTVTVAANAAPTITSAAVTTATVGVAYSYQVTATDPNAGTVLTYSLTTAPAGMTIDATTHVISWTPTATQTGAQGVTVRVQDQGGLFATQTFTVTVAGTPLPLPAGLVAAYAFNEGAGTTVADATGLGHTGTLVGATWTPSGRYGAGLVFNGTNARVTVPDAADLDLTTGVTLEAWVYPTTAGGGAWRTVITKDTAASGTYLLYANTDTNNAGMFVGSSFQQQVVGGPTLAANSWTHLAGTYDGITIRLYVNGVQVASRAQTAAMTPNNALLSIGGSSVWGEWFAGRLDELRIYNRALTAAEIQTDGAAPLP
jgi:hypothetical protein